MLAMILAATLSQAPLDAPVRFPPTGLAMREVPYTGGEIPAGAHLETRDNAWMFFSGAALGGVTYAASLTAGLVLGSILYLFTSDPLLLMLAIPVAGPFLSLTMLRGDFDSKPFLIAALATSGVAQVVGVGMMVFAAATRSTVVVVDDGPAVSLLPMPLPGGAGVAARLEW